LAPLLSFALGLVISRPPALLGADPFFAQFLAGIESTLTGQGMALVLQVVGGDGTVGGASYRPLAAEDRVDGVFLTDLRVEDSRFALLVQLGLSAIAVGRPIGACPFPAVMVDDRTGVAEAVAHLVARGASPH